MNVLSLDGLDAQNPLAFFAALGLLRVSDFSARQQGHERPRLSFVDEGRQTPRLHTALTLDEIVKLVLDDAAHCANDAALRLAYSDQNEEVSPDEPGATRDLKPPPVVARAYLSRLASGDRRAADLGAALFSELVPQGTDPNRVKPTAFHFTCGQQQFLEMAEDLRVRMRKDDVLEALVGPWQNQSTLPSFAWDASVTRMYALRASNPSGEKRGSIAAANWLGVQALAFFPVAVVRGRLVTTAVVGGWKDSVFTWPVWEPPLSVPTTAALLRTNVGRLSAREWAAWGITSVFSSKIQRPDKYGSFSPAAVVVPKERSGG